MEENNGSLMERQNGGVLMARPPKMVLAEAKEAAMALQEIIKGKKDPVIFNGQQYIEFEDWQVLARFYGIAAKVVSTTPVEYGNVRGFEARAVAIDTRTGLEVSAAEAMCLNDEDKWSARTKYEYKLILDDKGNKIWVKGKDGKSYPKSEKVVAGSVPVPMFQLKSMAQTRACAKALRNILAWVVVLAGYKPTPAEELPTDDNARKEEAQPTVSMPARKSEAAQEAPKQDAPKSNGGPDRSKMRAMTSKYDGKCGECGEPISAGEEIFYESETKKAYHNPVCGYVPA